MFKPSDVAGQPGARVPVRCVVLVMLLAPLMAWPIVTTTEPSGPAASAPTVSTAPAPVPASAPAGPVGGYQIRCWQDGRLLFEQNHVALPDTARYGVRISGTDTVGRPLFVAETRNATCLIRPAVEQRHWPR